MLHFSTRRGWPNGTHADAVFTTIPTAGRMQAETQFSALRKHARMQAEKHCSALLNAAMQTPVAIPSKPAALKSESARRHF